MKVNFHILSLFLFTLISSNQIAASPSDQDSLENILVLENTSEKEKFKARNELAELFFKYNINTSIEYLSENLNHPNIRNYPDLFAKGLYLNGRAHLFISEHEQANIFLNRAKDYFSENNNFKELGDCYKDLGTTQLHQNQYAEAENFYKKGLEAYEKENYAPGFAHCNLNLGNVYIEQHLYTKGIQFYYNALKVYEKEKMNRYVGMCHNNIGNIYKDIQNFEKAHEHYNQASKSYLVDNDSLQIINCNLNIGATFLDQGNYDKAIQTMYKTLLETKSTGFKFPIPTIYNNLTACHINLDNIELAEKNNQLAIQFAQSNRNSIELMNSHLLGAEIFIRKKEYGKSIELAEMVLEKAKQQNQLDLMREASKILAISFKESRQFENSIFYMEMHDKMKDSLFSEKKLRMPLSKDFEYQLEKQKQDQVLEATKAKLAWESKIAFQRLILLVFGIAFLILGLAAFVFFRNYRAKIKAETELENKNAMLEKYIESNIQLEQFAHIASHDLKSPLRTVGSFSSLLKRRAGSKLNENEMEYLDMISNAAKLMWNLVDDLMTYSQVNSLQMNLAPNNVNTLLEEVKANLDFSIHEKNADIQFEIMPDHVMVDETKIRQVFQNLIANSLKFMKEGAQPQIKVGCRKEKGFWKFSIQDNGIGIPDEYREKIFKPYKQLHTKAKFEGTGMGLAICKKIVEKHGGEISFESVEGEGTTFYFTLPMDSKKVTSLELMQETVA